MKKENIYLTVFIAVLVVLAYLGNQSTTSQLPINSSKNELVITEPVDTNLPGAMNNWVPAGLSASSSAGLMIPAGWKSQPGNDTESYSANVIVPEGNSSKSTSSDPYIIAFNLSKYVCLNGVDLKCSLDQLKQTTVDQAYLQIVNNIDNYSEIVDLKSLNKTKTLKLFNFKDSAIVYQGINTTSKPVEFYLFKSSTDIIGVSFVYPDKFDQDFKSEFLNKITP